MHILTLDIEEWALEKAKIGGGDIQRFIHFDEMLERTLDLLKTNHIHATCFCTGKMAEEFPHIIRKLAEQGHEIACHSHLHQWCNKMTKEDFENDTYIAVDTIEQCIGKKILGYRAPAFSITEKTPYAFETLSKNGIIYDASVFPMQRDFGGFPSFGSAVPSRIRYNDTEILEFPIPTARIFGKDIAWSGGGYFRLIPYPMISYWQKQSNYTMSYFHLNDLIQASWNMMSKERYEEYFKEPGTLKNRILRMVKGNISIGNTFNKLSKFITAGEFITIQTAIKKIDWANTPIIQL